MEMGDRHGKPVTGRPTVAAREVAGSCCSWSWRDGKWGAGHRGHRPAHAICRSQDGARTEVLQLVVPYRVAAAELLSVEQEGGSGLNLDSVYTGRGSQRESWLLIAVWPNAGPSRR